MQQTNASLLTNGNLLKKQIQFAWAQNKYINFDIFYFNIFISFEIEEMHGSFGQQIFTH